MNIEMFDSKLFKFGKYKLRITKFPQLSFGHLCLDMYMTFHLAKIEGSLVYFVPPAKKNINSGIFELKCDQVLKIREEDLPPEQYCEEIDEGSPTWPYYRRLLIKPPIPVRIPEHCLKEVEQLAREIGISSEAKIVTLHVREPGWYQSINHSLGRLDTWDYPTNARIESYRKAVGYLLSKGYTVIRIGTPTPTHVSGPGVIDLANSPHRTDLLELFCLMKSEFLITSEAEPRQAAEIMNVPFLTVNAVDPIGVYPIRKDGLFITKHIVDSKSGRTLSLLEMLSEGYQSALRDTIRWRYIDNTEDEILQAVIEIIDIVNGSSQESAFQGEYRERVCQASAALWNKCFYVRKWGADEGFIGDGRIAHFFAENYITRQS